MTSIDEKILILSEKAYDTGDINELVENVRINKNIISKKILALAMGLINELVNEQMENFTI